MNEHDATAIGYICTALAVVSVALCMTLCHRADVAAIHKDELKSQTDKP